MRKWSKLVYNEHLIFHKCSNRSHDKETALHCFASWLVKYTSIVLIHIEQLKYLDFWLPDLFFNKATPNFVLKISLYAYSYMGGLVLMGISTKNWEFLPNSISTMWIIQPHYYFFTDFILTYRSRQVIICKNITKKSTHPLSNKIQTFLNFWLII